MLAFNLSRGFQLATTAQRRAPSGKRLALFAFETIHTLRALCFQRAGVLVQPQGRAERNLERARTVHQAARAEVLTRAAAFAFSTGDLARR